MFILTGMSIVLITGEDLKAKGPPETLKAYFESFATRKKEKINDPWFSPDKGYHVIGSMMSMTLITNISMRGFDQTRSTSRFVGASVSAGFGVIKELYDAKKPDNQFSWKDLAANGVGLILGVLLTGIQ
jgi:uncharacterized protein YfiM (DUF2279 family)